MHVLVVFNKEHVVNHVCDIHHNSFRAAALGFGVGWCLCAGCR